MPLSFALSAKPSPCRRGKSGWGNLLRIEPLRPGDVLHPTRIVYLLKATPKLRQRFEFRVTFRNVLGKDRRLVSWPCS